MPQETSRWDLVESGVCRKFESTLSREEYLLFAREFVIFQTRIQYDHPVHIEIRRFVRNRTQDIVVIEARFAW